MGLQKFEGRLERIVDGTFSKAFRGELHPVEIGRRLTREMDLKRQLGVHGLIAPNYFEVCLSSVEFERFESFLDALVRELEEAAREHARTEDYVFVGPVTVVALEDPSQRRGRFAILSEVRESAPRRDTQGGQRRGGGRPELDQRDTGQRCGHSGTHLGRWRRNRGRNDIPPIRDVVMAAGT